LHSTIKHKTPKHKDQLYPKQEKGSSDGIRQKLPDRI